MKRREFAGGMLALLGACVLPLARASVPDHLGSAEATQVVRDSLAKISGRALAKLGQEDGFLGNPNIKINLPKNYARADALLRTLGQGRKVDDLVLSMNRAAEMAVPKVEQSLIQAAKTLALQDAKVILLGGEDALTAYFRQSTEAQLGVDLAPVIRRVADPSGLTRAYDNLSRKLVQLAGLKSKQSTVEDYVKLNAIHGIFAVMSEEERVLRANPTQYLNAAAGKIYGLTQ
jgi:hypothetical protein